MRITSDPYGNLYFEGAAQTILNVKTGTITAMNEFTARAQIPTVFSDDDSYFKFVDSTV